MRRLKLIGGLTVIAFVAIPASAQAAAKISWSGSTSVHPLAVQLAKAYNKPKGYFVFGRIGGSDIGVSDARSGKVSIGLASRDPRGGDTGTKFTKIANDGLCIVTNRQNRVRNLNTSQIQAIFSGAARDWSQIPGSSVSGTVALLTRTQASGSQDAFQQIFMGDRSVSRAAAQQRSSGLVKQRVGSNPRGIGYIDFAFTGGLNTVAYNGVGCTLRNAKSGQYGGLRSFYMVTRGEPRGAAAAWIKWIRTSSRAKRIIAQNYVPLR